MGRKDFWLISLFFLIRKAALGSSDGSSVYFYQSTDGLQFIIDFLNKRIQLELPMGSLSGFRSKYWPLLPRR